MGITDQQRPLAETTTPPPAPAPERQRARRALRQAGYEIKQYDGHLLLDGQHSSDEDLIALARDLELME